MDITPDGVELPNPQRSSAQPGPTPGADLQQMKPPDTEWPWPAFPLLSDNERPIYQELGKLSTGWEGAFLDAFRNTGNQRRAAQHAHIAQTTVWRRIQQDPLFSQAFSEARKMALSLLEAAAWNRAINGVSRTKYVYQGGKQLATETITDYSDTLLIFLLKANDPATYRETVTHEHNLNILRQEVERVAKQEGLDVEVVWEEAKALAANNT